MKFRLMGTAAEVTAVVSLLRACPGLHVTTVSRPYPNHTNPDQVRVYLDTDLTPDHDLPEDAR